MLEEHVRIGMRVVPFQKTAFGNLEHSNVWKDALNKNQSYLYIVGWDTSLNYFVLDDENFDNGDNGDYYNAEDFEPYEETRVVQQIVTEQQIKILNAVDRYISKYPFAKDGGSEYVSQSDDPQVGAIDLACELADIYCEYNEKGVNDAKIHSR